MGCPRAMFWSYLFGGRGLSMAPGPVYFDTGNAVHAGLATALRFIKEGHSEPTWDLSSKCVLAGLQDFDSRTRINEAPPSEDQFYATIESRYREEQRDVAAALIYAWCVEEWIGFAARYDILLVERDGEFVTEHTIERNVIKEDDAGFKLPTKEIIKIRIHWESKADAIVREKIAPHQTAVISWKTAANVNPWTRAQYRSDLQGQLECFFGSLMVNQPIDYNQVIYLVKGNKLRLDSERRILSKSEPFEKVRSFKTESPLIYPYTKPDGEPPRFWNEVAGIEPDIAWHGRYYPPGEESYKQLRGWKNDDRFTLNEAPPSDNPDEVPEPYLFHWIDKLHEGKIFPTPDYMNGETALGRSIVWEQRTMRNEELTKNLIEQIAERQIRLHTSTQPDVDFYQNLKDCYDSSPTGCEFLDPCIKQGSGRLIQLSEWNPDVFSVEIPKGFEWRIPHHKAEKDSFDEVPF